MKSQGNKSQGNGFEERIVFYRKVGLSIGLVLFCIFWLMMIAATWAEAKEDSKGDSAKAEVSDSDEDYNFNWLDPDKKIYVLQNRKYVKANRLLMSVMVGPGFSNPYKTAYNLDPRIGYNVSEDWGFELFYTATFNSNNSTFNALVQSSPNTWPLVRETQSQFGAMLRWSPWYAKINVFNKIFYFDWYFGAGVGSTQANLELRTFANGPSTFVNQSYMSGFLSTGQEYHLTHDFIIRLDLTGSYYSAPVYGTSGPSSLFSNYNFGIGIGYRL